jgi:hypothetical protein
VDYNADTRQLKPAELMSLSDRVAHENIRKGVLSATGEKFVQLIKP